VGEGDRGGEGRDHPQTHRCEIVQATGVLCTLFACVAQNELDALLKVTA